MSAKRTWMAGYSFVVDSDEPYIVAYVTSGPDQGRKIVIHVTEQMLADLQEVLS